MTAKEGWPLVIRFAEVPIGTAGFIRCTACARTSATVTTRSAADVAADLERVAEDWFGPGPNVAFIGQEPFTHRELPQLIDAAVSRGFERIRLRTDGVALGQHGNAAGALGAGVRHVEFVLVGGSTSTHDALVGHAGHFDASNAGASAVHAAAVAERVDIVVTVVVPVCRHNVAELPQTVALAASRKAVAVVLDLSGLKPTPEREGFVMAALETATVNRIAARVTGWDMAGAEHRRSPWDVAGVPS